MNRIAVLHRILLLLTALTVTAGACADNETAIARGDRLWADSSFTEALAEYRLAVEQRDDEEALARLAHAYAAQGQLTEARDAYAELLSRSSAWVDQAVYDFLHLMERAMARGDEFGVATALDAALSLRPELQRPDAFRPVARFHRETGARDRALEYYRRALTTLPADSTPEILYEIGRLNEDLERCETAIDWFRAFRIQARSTNPRRWRSLLAEAEWHTGNCAFLLAREAQTQGRAREALEYYRRTIELGEPENLLDRAWFEQGEILFHAGRFDQALEAYRTVLRRSPSRTGQLVERAERRIDEIRFGVRTDGIAPDTT
ncbi:MAG: tetratricopeptide repeat protein [Longimicrobiales bacterium]